MIRFGPAGIPLSCKGRTLRDGIEDVHNLGLSALEVQLVRINLVERYPSEDELGLSLRQVPGDLVVKMRRKDGKNVKEITNLNTRIEKGDILYSFPSSIGHDFRELADLKVMAKELDVEMSLHTPYYMDMIAGDETRDKSEECIRWSGLIAGEIGATVCVTHMGLYGMNPKEVAAKRVEESLRRTRSWFKKSNIAVPIGLETAGKQDVFGTLEEVMALCKKLDGLVPVINFTHLHSREGGSLKKKEDFEDIFHKCGKFSKRLHCHFSGVEHEEGNELRYTPIKKGDLRFEPLIETILENRHDVVLISGSPLLEHDAMYMKVIMERVIMRRITKSKRKKEDEDAN